MYDEIASYTPLLKKGNGASPQDMMVFEPKTWATIVPSSVCTAVLNSLIVILRATDGLIPPENIIRIQTRSFLAASSLQLSGLSVIGLTASNTDFRLAMCWKISQVLLELCLKSWPEDLCSSLFIIVIKPATLLWSLMPVEMLNILECTWCSNAVFSWNE